MSRGPGRCGMRTDLLDAITTGDARKLAENIPDESVHLILCDPVYWQIEDYAWLAKLGERVLVPGGNLIAQAGSLYLYEVMVAIRQSSLIPQPLLAEVYSFAHWQLFKPRVMGGWKPHIWASKGTRRGQWMFDRSSGGGRDKSNHEWGDSPQMFRELISRLTAPGESVLDPFTGSGTVPAVCNQLGRHYIAFEIDPETAERARQRVANTQPALFILEPEQLALENV